LWNLEFFFRGFGKIRMRDKHQLLCLFKQVEYALNFPWYASLSRIEHRTYLDHYGTNDIWIGKSLYKMPYVNNEVFLDLAKADFNMCQSIHQKELEELLRSELQPLHIH
jgi:hypothetical protein